MTEIPQIPTKTGGATNDSPPTSPSKGEELTQEQLADQQMSEDFFDETYDVEEIEFGL